jgi:hypothetical protein
MVDDGGVKAKTHASEKMIEVKSRRPKWYTFRPGPAMIVAGAVGALVVIAWLLLGYADQRAKSAYYKSIRIGNDLIEALNTYRSDNARYPASLDELMPKYSTKIKQPPWGARKWGYYTSADNAEKFVLSVRSTKTDTDPHYDSSSGIGWYYDDQ